MELEDNRKVRIISGGVTEVENQLNRLLESYTMTSITYSIVKDELVLTAFLIHQSEMRKAALAAPNVKFGRSQ